MTFLFWLLVTNFFRVRRWNLLGHVVTALFRMRTAFLLLKFQRRIYLSISRKILPPCLMVAIADVVTALHVVSGTLLIVDRLKGGGVAATTSDLSPHLHLQQPSLTLSGTPRHARCCSTFYSRSCRRVYTDNIIK